MLPPELRPESGHAACWLHSRLRHGTGRLGVISVSPARAAALLPGSDAVCAAAFETPGTPPASLTDRHSITHIACARLADAFKPAKALEPSRNLPSSSIFKCSAICCVATGSARCLCHCSVPTARSLCSVSACPENLRRASVEHVWRLLPAEPGGRCVPAHSPSLLPER